MLEVIAGALSVSREPLNIITPAWGLQSSDCRASRPWRLNADSSATSTIQYPQRLKYN
jgi:hypothetical protein